MADALRREIPDAQFTVPDGGFFIWLRLPAGVGAKALQPLALRHGAEFLSGARCFTDGSGDEFIRLAFSEEPAERIERAVARIGAAVRELQAAG
jgi:2-aminoadipate transaminase